MGIEPTSEVGKLAIQTRFIGLGFDCCRHLCWDKFRMSALIFISGLLAVLAGTDATVSTAGDQCAVCKSCNAFICRVLA